MEEVDFSSEGWIGGFVMKEDKCSVVCVLKCKQPFCISLTFKLSAYTSLSACMCDHFLQSCLALCDPMAPPSMEYSRQEWSGLPCPPPGDLPEPGVEPVSPVLQAISLPWSHLGSLWL